MRHTARNAIDSPFAKYDALPGWEGSWGENGYMYMYG